MINEIQTSTREKINLFHSRTFAVSSGDDAWVYGNVLGVELHGRQHTKTQIMERRGQQVATVKPIHCLTVFWDTTPKQTATVFTVLLDIWTASQEFNCCFTVRGATVITWWQIKVAFLIRPFRISRQFGSFFFLPIFGPQTKEIQIKRHRGLLGN